MLIDDPLRPLESEDERLQRLIGRLLNFNNGGDEPPHPPTLHKYHTDAEFHAAVRLAAIAQLRLEDMQASAKRVDAGAMSVPWSGTVGMLGVLTIDGRRLDAVRMHAPVPVATLGREGGWPSQTVGLLTSLTVAGGGELRGAGWLDASLLPYPQREYDCGLDVDLRGGGSVEVVDGVLVIPTADLSRLMLYVDGATQPAWPGCRVTFGETPAELTAADANGPAPGVLGVAMGIPGDD